MGKAPQALGHPLHQLHQRVEVGRAALYSPCLGLEAVVQDRVGQEVQQGKEHQVGVVMEGLDLQLVQEGQVAMVRIKKCSSCSCL